MRSLNNWWTDPLGSGDPTIKITRDQWEGLQFELSELKSQVSELQSYANGHARYHNGEDEVDLGEMPTLEEILEELKQRNTEKCAEGVHWFGEHDAQYGTCLYCGTRVEPATLEEAVEELRRKDGYASGIRSIQDDPEDAAPLEDWGLDTLWTERIPLRVTLVDGPPGLDLGPFVLITPEERVSILEGYLSQVEELAAEWNRTKDGYRERISLLEGALVNRNRQVELLKLKVPRWSQSHPLPPRNPEPSRPREVDDWEVDEWDQAKEAWSKLVEGGPPE